MPPKEPEVDADTSPSQLEADSQAPVDLPDAATNGNPLPELSIHSLVPCRLVGLFLTTANPKVSEESLSEFARAQGGLMPDLKPLHAYRRRPAPIPRQIACCMDWSTSAKKSHHVNYPESRHPRESKQDIQASTLAERDSAAHSLDARQRFMQQANMSGDMLATMDAKVANSKPESDEMMTKSSEALAQTGQTRQAELLQQIKQANERTNPDLAQAKSTLSTMLSGQVEGLADRAIAGTELFRNKVRPIFSPSPKETERATCENASSTLIQTPLGNVPVSLVDALLSSDPAQMQSRLQPYQVWVQRFGEVLAQKLAWR